MLWTFVTPVVVSVALSDVVASVPGEVSIVLSALGAREILASVDVSNLISIVLIVSAFGFVVGVVSSLLKGVLISSREDWSTDGIAVVELSPELEGFMVVAAALVSFDVLFVSGESVGS